KGLKWGGSLARKEATGYGSVYFASNMLKARNMDLEGATCAVSGSGNVAIYTIEKLYQLGAKPVTASDSRGCIYHPGGINLDALKQVKEVERASLARYAELCKDAKYIPAKEYPKDQHPVWNVPCKLAFPSATQNEVAAPTRPTSSERLCPRMRAPTCPPLWRWKPSFRRALRARQSPTRAACPPASSMAQTPYASGPLKGDAKLKNIMANIFKAAHETAEEFGVPGNYVLGGNIAGFRKVADSMIEQGLY
ncbi:MAG: NADP-specific glutamate dehydrogenase, partial [Bilophila wadsworthia]